MPDGAIENYHELDQREKKLLDHKVAEAVARRDLNFYNEQAGKDFNQIFKALSGIIPTVRYQVRQRIAGQIYRSHKKGKIFDATHQIIASNGQCQFQIFTVSLSPHAPIYVNWNSAKNSLCEIILAEMEDHKRRG